MNKALFSLLAAGAALALPSAAAADNGTSLRDVYDAGRCMVERDRHAAVSLLGTLPIDATPAIARRAIWNCWPASSNRR